MDKKTIKHCPALRGTFRWWQVQRYTRALYLPRKEKQDTMFFIALFSHLYWIFGGIVGGVTYKWKHNTLLSILIGTVVYMVLLWVR